MGSIRRIHSHNVRKRHILVGNDDIEVNTEDCVGLGREDSDEFLQSYRSY